jgi:hypothetical protein
MKRVSFNIGTHGVETTASEMRRRLAQVLSQIPGDQKVFFSLTLHLENYAPASANFTVGQPHDDMTRVMGELARPEND